MANIHPDSVLDFQIKSDFVQQKGERVKRPTEREAERNIKRFEKMFGSVKWRVEKFGCVRLTKHESKLLEHSKDWLDMPISRRHQSEQSYIAMKMRINQSNVSRGLKRAENVLLFLDAYPSYRIKAAKTDIIELEHFIKDKLQDAA